MAPQQPDNSDMAGDSDGEKVRRERGLVVPRLVRRRTEHAAPADDDTAFALHVSFPARDFDVMAAVDFEYHDGSVRQDPLAVEVAFAATAISSEALPVGCTQSELPAHSGDVELAQRLRSARNIADGQAQMSFVADATHHVQLVG